MTLELLPVAAALLKTKTWPAGGHVLKQWPVRKYDLPIVGH